MGVYYEVVNLDLKETICISDGASIKWHTYSGGCYSPQIAILMEFLGARPFHGAGKEWEGRWAGHRIEIQNDSGPDTLADIEDWPDVGTEYLVKLDEKGMLDEWLSFHGIDNVYLKKRIATIAKGNPDV